MVTTASRAAGPSRWLRQLIRIASSLARSSRRTHACRWLPALCLLMSLGFTTRAGYPSPILHELVKMVTINRGSVTACRFVDHVLEPIADRPQSTLSGHSLHATATGEMPNAPIE